MLLEYNSQIEIKGFSLLYFYASWSSNCNLHKESIKRIDNENKDLNIYRINVTKFPNLKQKYSIHKIPSYIILYEGNILSRLDGYTDGYSLSRWVKRNRT